MSNRCSSCGAELERYDILRGRCRSCVDGAPPPAAKADIILTTESAGLPIARRLGVVAAECVLGMHLGKDLLAAVRDVAGGRSGSMEAVFAEGRRIVLESLRTEASQRGADAVIAVAIHYSDLTGGGKNMILVTGTGTAVTIVQGG